MTSEFTAKLDLANEAVTQALARAIAPVLEAGDVILLSGPIGAGKTALCRAIIQHRLSQIDALEDVPSPTFTLVQSYDLGAVEIWHADLYRLTSPHEAIELGLEEAFENAICLVEWPDRLGDLTPDTALHFDLSYGDKEDARILELQTQAPKWIARLPEILAGIEGEHV
ncbi:MAG: tRNA threonylcarbamoyladenosine biosynthesis protein TsaE [Halocynthiibacter sp.]|jgi:tRNA threonylcarbamoyladenosine biosynthesis protein TsaE